MKYIIILAVTLTLVSCKDKSQEAASLPYYTDATFTPEWLQPNSNELNHLHTVSNFELVNQDGDTITQSTFDNHIYIVDFFFTICPGICPKMTANMAVIQDEFMDDDEVLLLSHSVTPDRDSVSILKEYADKKGVKSGKWHLVTGDRQEIYRLGRKEYFIEEDLGIERDLEEFLHTENFVLIDKNKHIRGIYNGLNKASIRNLISDIKTLQNEI